MCHVRALHIGAAAARVHSNKEMAFFKRFYFFLARPVGPLLFVGALFFVLSAFYMRANTKTQFSAYPSSARRFSASFGHVLALYNSPLRWPFPEYLK